MIDYIDNPIQVYLHEVAKVAPLTDAQEMQLIARIRKGGEDAETAKKDLVEANLGEVVSIAREYAQETGRLLDLIQQGNLGLLKAANDLGDSSYVSFSTHAAGYIRQAIADAPPALALTCLGIPTPPALPLPAGRPTPLRYRDHPKSQPGPCAVRARPRYSTRTRSGRSAALFAGSAAAA